VKGEKKEKINGETGDFKLKINKKKEKKEKKLWKNGRQKNNRPLLSI